MTTFQSTDRRPRATRTARFVPFLGALTAVLALGTAPIRATSYVMVSDADLADQAGVIAQVEITAVGPGPAGEVPATDYLAEISEVVKGDVPGSTIVVRVPGGERADGLSLKVWGAPEFAVGERALLFLEAGADGVYRPLHLMLGAFHEAAGGELAVRNLAGAERIQKVGDDDSSEESPRDLSMFTAWLADRAAGDDRAPDYQVDAQDALSLKYSLLTPADGVPVRWFGGATWRVHQAGQPGLTLDETVARFSTALEAWNQEPNSDLSLSYGGLTSATRGLGGNDGTNSVTFGDPNGQVAGSYSCKSGGVVAAGGPYFYGSTRSYGGRSYHEAFEADIVTNDGSECYFRDNPRGTEEVLAHELGHTLGIGHSGSSDALMFHAAHSDGRGVRFTADDCAAAALVYGDGVVHVAPAGPPGKPPASATIALTAKARSAKEIKLTWKHSLKQLSEIRVDVQKNGGEFVEVAVLRGTVKTTTLKALTAKTAYAFRIRALKDGVVVAQSGVAQTKTK